MMDLYSADHLIRGWSFSQKSHFIISRSLWLVLLAGLLILGWMPNPWLIQEGQTRPHIEKMIRAIPGLSHPEHRELTNAFQKEFHTDTGSVSLNQNQIESMRHIVHAGIFEEAAPLKIAEMAHKAVLAELRGADPEIVEDLVLIGFTRPVSDSQLEVSAKMLDRFSKSGIDPYVYQDIVQYALANDWPASVLSGVTEGLIRNGTDYPCGSGWDCQSDLRSCGRRDPIHTEPEPAEPPGNSAKKCCF